MKYQIIPVGGLWEDGMFSVPAAITDKYLKLASEYQLKAVLILLRKNGVSCSEEIAKTLGITEADAAAIMEFWIAEGVAAESGAAPCEPVESKSVKIKKEISISAPVLTPADIVCAAEENPEIEALLNEAQIVLAHTLSHSEQEMLVNLINFYGMKFEIILMILGFVKKRREENRRTAAGYIYKIAQNWLEEGIETVSAAEEKIKEIESSGKLWNQITELAGIRHSSPTQKQQEMILGWSRDFSFEMIALAIDAMKEGSDKPSLPYVNKVLAAWKKNGVFTPAAVEKHNAEFARSKEAGNQKKNGAISRKATYDLDEIKRNAMNNTDIKY